MKMTDKLDALMNDRKIKRGELAKEAGVPYTTLVGYYERGYQNAKLSNLRQLAEYFDCSLDYLVNDHLDVDIVRDSANKKTALDIESGKYGETIKLLKRLPDSEIPGVNGYLKHLVYECEAAEAAKQIIGAG